MAAAATEGVAATKQDHVTITLRARYIGTEPSVGTLVASPKGGVIYRVLEVWRVRRAGDQRYALRLACRRLSRTEVPKGAEVLPWPRDPRTPRQRRPAAPSGGQSVNPDQGEPPAALIERIRVARAGDELTRIARAARVGSDDGVRHGQDYGPGLRLRPARGRHRGERLREADVEIEDGPDPARPNNTVRRARRSDPLVALLRAGTITMREFDAAELLRDELQAAQTPIPCTGQSSIHVSPYQRIGISDRQVNATSASRRSLAAVGVLNRAVVLWIVLGGTIRGYATFAHVRHTTSAEQLRSGLVALAEHYQLAMPAHRY
jgi:hypothetical protein